MKTEVTSRLQRITPTTYRWQTACTAMFFFLQVALIDIYQDVVCERRHAARCLTGVPPSCHLGCRFVVGENTWIILLARIRPGSLSDAFALAARNSSYAKQTHRPYHTQWCYICWLMQMTDLSQSIYIRGGKLTFWSSSLRVWQIPAFNQTTHYSIKNKELLKSDSVKGKHCGLRHLTA